MQGFYIRNYSYDLGKSPPITVHRTLGTIFPEVEISSVLISRAAFPYTI